MIHPENSNYVKNNLLLDQKSRIKANNFSIFGEFMSNTETHVKMTIKGLND